jgi:UDP-N-acetylmuramate--alanine ligase
MATLKGARHAFGRRLVVAFQPHRHTRTRDLLDDFARAFNDADLVVVSDIYAAGEDPIEGVSSKTLVERVQACGHRDATYVPARNEVARHLLPRLRPGDLVITLGAGDINQVGPELLGLLQAKG